MLTTREASALLKQSSIDLAKLDPVAYDQPFATGTGAAVIFAATGGVMEAALRTAYFVITGRNVPFKNLDISPCRGLKGVKEATVKLEKVLPKFKHLESVEVKVAIAHGIENARNLLEQIKRLQAEKQPVPWHFIEVMACPGGCVGGGGQPKPTNLDIISRRTDLIYKEDKDLPQRQSHENSEVTQIYTEFFKHPLSKVSEQYLHTKYSPKPVNYAGFFDMREADSITQRLEAKGFKKNDPSQVVEMLLHEANVKGHISDCAMVQIAKHSGIHPIQVASSCSGYMYLPTKPVGENVLYVCNCLNC